MDLWIYINRVTKQRVLVPAYNGEYEAKVVMQKWISESPEFGAIEHWEGRGKMRNLHTQVYELAPEMGV